jgi:hypothetical protein
MRRHAIALKAGFNPDQPRVPAGNPDGGQWTSGGGGDSATDFSDARKRPGIGHNRPPINDPSDIPPERPDSAWERNLIAQAIARSAALVSYYFAVIATTSHWLNEMYWEIKANQDPPKTLDELQDAVSQPDKRGYDDHHIVLRSAGGPGITESRIKGLDNIVRIPRYRHWQINRWYETPNDLYGGLRPREYLQGRSWDEQRRVGIDMLREVGVLKP